MAKTHDDLMAAFAGESQANRRYLAFAKKADDEGFPQVARLFRAVAHGETIHALSHLRTAGMVKSTAENLQEAIGGETYEFTTMYPEFITEAETAGEKKAVNSLQMPWKWKRCTKSCTAKRSRTWISRRKSSSITFARCAVMCMPAAHPKSARFAAQWAGALRS